MTSHSNLIHHPADALSAAQAAIAHQPGLGNDDIRRIQEMVHYLQTHHTTDILEQLLPPTPSTSLITSLVGTSRLVHGALVVFPDDLDAASEQLSKLGLKIGPPVPSHVVANRLARRYGMNPDDLDVQIRHAAIPLPAGEDPRDVEIFLATSHDELAREQIAQDERDHNREIHFALAVRPDRRTVGILWGLLIVGRLDADGGGYNPDKGCTVLYFRAPGVMDCRRRWPRRLELQIEGHHPDFLRTHQRATPNGR